MTTRQPEASRDRLDNDEPTPGVEPTYETLSSPRSPMEYTRTVDQTVLRNRAAELGKKLSEEMSAVRQRCMQEVQATGAASQQLSRLLQAIESDNVPAMRKLGLNMQLVPGIVAEALVAERPIELQTFDACSGLDQRAQPETALRLDDAGHAINSLFRSLMPPWRLRINTTALRSPRHTTDIIARLDNSRYGTLSQQHAAVRFLPHPAYCEWLAERSGKQAEDIQRHGFTIMTLHLHLEQHCGQQLCSIKTRKPCNWRFCLQKVRNATTRRI